MTLGDVIIDVKNSKKNNFFRVASEISTERFAEEQEVLNEKDYSIFRGIMRKNLGGVNCYDFFEKIGFVPINMKENYLAGEKIYNPRNGPYVPEDIN